MNLLAWIDMQGKGHTTLVVDLYRVTWTQEGMMIEYVEDGGESVATIEGATEFSIYGLNSK